MKVNIKDVAKEADVSVATVSRVIRGVPGIREKTRTKVLKAIKKLNYEVNYIGRNLRKRNTNIIGVIVGNVLSPFYSIIAKAIEDVAMESGYSIMLCNGDDNPKKELEYLKVLKSNGVDGIILAPTGMNKKYLNQLIESGTNIVLIDRLISGIKCDAVLVDNIKGAYNAVNFFLDLGYKRIGIIVSHMDKTIGKERLKGYLKALEDKGIKKDDNIIKKMKSFDREEIKKLTRELLINPKIPEVIFSTTLNTTLFVLKVMQEKGLYIQRDIGLVGFDDSEWFDFLCSPITTIKQPVYEIGSIATEMLIKKIKTNSRDRHKEKTTILKLSTELVSREH
jgi:DNA-binding LacI/PurR family transcriptional regulator